jgi:DNA-binding transcriptional ArsR family regulator
MLKHRFFLKGSLFMSTYVPNATKPPPSWAPSQQAAQQLLMLFAAGGALIGLVGFADSFWQVANAASPYLGWASWTLPVLIDLGIFVLSGLSLLLELHSIRSWWMRLIPNGLASYTVYLNTATQHTLFGRAAHAAGPLLWIVVVEIAAFTVRQLAGLSTAPGMDKVRTSRWLLAPLATFRLWRRMRLWEITSYREAVNREHARVASRHLLREWHGPAWRRTAPSAQRLAVKLQACTARPVADLLTEAATGIMAAAAAAGRPIGADGRADAAPDADRSSDGQGSATHRPRRRTPSSNDTAAKVAKLAAKLPDASTAELAKRLGVSDRTVRRHLAAVNGVGRATDEPDRGEVASLDRVAAAA